MLQPLMTHLIKQAEQKIPAMTTDLDRACGEAAAQVLEGLPLQDLITLINQDPTLLTTVDPSFTEWEGETPLQIIVFAIIQRIATALRQVYHVSVE